MHPGKREYCTLQITFFHQEMVRDRETPTDETLKDKYQRFFTGNCL